MPVTASPFHSPGCPCICMPYAFPHLRRAPQNSIPPSPSWHTVLFLFPVPLWLGPVFPWAPCKAAPGFPGRQESAGLFSWVAVAVSRASLPRSCTLRVSVPCILHWPLKLARCFDSGRLQTEELPLESAFVSLTGNSFSPLQQKLMGKPMSFSSGKFS